MVGVKVSQESPAGPLSGPELVRIVQGGGNARATAAEIAAVNRTVYVEDYGAVGDGTATTGTDNSAAFAAALADSLYVTVRNKSGRYWLKNVDIPSGRTLDLSRAIIQPAAGADYCFKLADRTRLINGEFRDSPRNLLKSTTLTVSALAGATTVTVADPSIFFVEGLIVIVSDNDSGLTAPYDGPKLAVNHAVVQGIVGNVITLSEPLQFNASAGKLALTSQGCMVVEASNTVIENHYITTVPLAITVRSPVGGSNIGRTYVNNLEINTCDLGGIVELGSVSSSLFTNIRGYLGVSGASYITAFGHKTDATQATSTKGGHHFSANWYLGSQEGFDFQDSSIVSLTDCYADTLSGTGLRLNSTVDVLVTAMWSAFNGKGISISNGSARVSIFSCYLYAQAPTCPWGTDIELEVEDGCTSIYIDKNNWRRAQFMRATAGWSTINNVTFSIDQQLSEDGTSGAPSRSWRLDPDTGWYRAASGEERFMSNGGTRFRVNGQGAGFQDGDVSAPAMFWGGDIDTGLYYATGAQRVAVNGAARWFWGDNDSGPTNTPLRLPSVTLGTANGLPGLTAGQQIYISNGRKVGEGAGAGTGVVAYYSNAAWRRPSDDTAVVT